MYKLHKAIDKLGATHLIDLKEDWIRIKTDDQRQALITTNKELQEKINELNQTMTEKDKFLKDLQKKVETIKEEKNKLVKTFQINA